jgi:hypothetical protein
LKSPTAMAVGAAQPLTDHKVLQPEPDDLTTVALTVPVPSGTI